MFIRPDGESNRWKIYRNEDTGEVEFCYEGLCPVAGRWVTISTLVFDDEIDEQIEFDIKRRIKNVVKNRGKIK